MQRLCCCEALLCSRSDPETRPLLHRVYSTKRTTASTARPLAYPTISTVSIQENDVPAWATSPKSKLGFLSFGPRRGATKLDAPSPTNFSFPYTPVPEGSGGPHSNTRLPANASANSNGCQQVIGVRRHNVVIQLPCRLPGNASEAGRWRFCRSAGREPTNRQHADRHDPF